MTSFQLSSRDWIPQASSSYIEQIATNTKSATPAQLVSRLENLIAENRSIHDVECVNLNPATNTMNPRAEAALAAGLSARTSLGYAGAKYEMGLEAIEQIEVIAAELAAEVFHAGYAEVRVPSGAIANLYAFMACAAPGDSIIVPPGSIGGHVTHHDAGAAGLYGLNIHEAPIDADHYTVDTSALAALAKDVQPKLISVGGSLNLEHHDVAAVKEIAVSVGAQVLFDAAHLSGPIAGGSWPNPLDAGADLMTMSTYKSLGGPTAGLLVTNNAAIAERVDAIAFPGLTANFDAGKTAALAITLVDWLAHGKAYAATMVDAAQTLATELAQRDIAVFQAGAIHTRSHAFALDVSHLGGGQLVAEHLRRANLLTCAIGLPSGPNDGLRIGTNEIVRWGANDFDMAELAELVALGLGEDPEAVGPVVSAYRQKFDTLHFCQEEADGVHPQS